MSTKKEIKAIQIESENKIIKLGQQEFDRIVKPWLIQKGYRFSAGMGTWAMWDDNDRLLDKNKIPTKIRELLQIDMPNQDLGSLLNDFDPHD